LPHISDSDYFLASKNGHPTQIESATVTHQINEKKLTKNSSGFLKNKENLLLNPDKIMDKDIIGNTYHNKTGGASSKWSQSGRETHAGNYDKHNLNSSDRKELKNSKDAKKQKVKNINEFVLDPVNVKLANFDGNSGKNPGKLAKKLPSEKRAKKCEPEEKKSVGNRQDGSSKNLHDKATLIEKINGAQGLGIVNTKDKGFQLTDGLGLGGGNGKNLNAVNRKPDGGGRQRLSDHEQNSDLDDDDEDKYWRVSKEDEEEDYNDR
jgi:hypothetical protein